MWTLSKESSFWVPGPIRRNWACQPQETHQLLLFDIDLHSQKVQSKKTTDVCKVESKMIYLILKVPKRLRFFSMEKGEMLFSKILVTPVTLKLVESWYLWPFQLETSILWQYISTEKYED